MSPAPYRVRRATLEDMGALLALWRGMRFAADELARKITEFQVAEDSQGQLLGALGLQITEKQGRIHSEAFTDFALAESLRPQLWERVQSVANNHGLLRLWTQEQAPFWNHCGMSKAEGDVLQRLPSAWRQLPGGWLTLKLRDDPEALISADKEFAMFMEAEKQRTQRALRQAKFLKLIATLIALALLVTVVLGALYVLRLNPRLLGR